MLSAEIKGRAKELGYVACGIIPSATFHEHIHFLDERAAAFPGSKKLYERFYANATPPEAGRSIIVCTESCAQYKVPDALNGVIGKLYLFDGSIPYSHERRRELEFETYLKTLGLNTIEHKLPSRWAAAKAGVGAFGRNNFIYSQEHGSYILILSWVVDKELDYDTPSENTFSENGLAAGCDESCQKCVQACPTQALSGALSMDIGKCVARLSYFAKDILDEDTRTRMGPWLYGCDVCQDVCPLNQGKLTGTEAFPLLSEFERYLTLEAIFEMSEDVYMNVILPRFSYTGKDGLWLWKANALRSMINSADSKYHCLIKKSCGSTDERIREVGRWGCEKLGL